MIPGAQKRISRRELLQASVVTGSTLVLGFDKALCAALPQVPGRTTPEQGKLLGVVPFSQESRVAMETPLGAELDGRLYTDLSKLTPESTITPSESFYLRTRASELLEAQKLHEIRIGGLAAKESVLPLEELRKSVKPMGVHLMECAGNLRSVHFGLMSAAEWSGVPLIDVLESVKPKSQGNRILVSGFDIYANKSKTSVEGASWIFKLDELKAAGAFLATEMNGAPLTKDHGAPLRLLVPGWYGCTCIKWVNEISFVDEGAEATSQMAEYAARTMQKGAPKLAKDYQPALVEAAAMPIRVEKWVVGEKIQYLVVGVVWGGTRAVTRLQIRFNPEEDYVAVEYLQPGGINTWRFWTHEWVPARPDSYHIRLRVADSGVATKRLDAGYYMRSVEIQEV
jgi:DMSO/TMAO reductase YedYZ molybdopterin-dependent catalytic subunit